MNDHNHDHEGEHHIHVYHRKECKDLLGSLSEYVDGVLEEELCREIEAHMAECENCRVVVDTLTRTVELYQTAPTPDLPDDVKERLYTRLRFEDFLNGKDRTGE
jgi:predicted anti-sigma-YlaC factor YlaD